MSDEYKVLPFETTQGNVPGHEIRRYTYDWLKSPIKYVQFSRFDQVAQMSILISVHWTEFTRYTKRTWPKGGSIKAVILENGQTITADSRSVIHYDDAAYLKAPIVCRDAFMIASMGSGYPLLEVVGVFAWARSDRSEAAADKHLACPWQRDNTIFESRK